MRLRSSAALAVLTAAALSHVGATEVTVVSPRGERRVPVVSERGFPAVSVAQLGAVLNIETMAAPRGAASLRVAGRSFVFVLEAAYFRFEGDVYALAAWPYVARDSLFMPLQWAVEYLPRLIPFRYRYDAARRRLEELPAGAERPDVAAAPASRPATSASTGTARRRVVALDAGHGGRDDGMVGPIGQRAFLREKDVTLAIARLVAGELQRRGIGAILTRTTDSLVGLFDRGPIAGRRGADIFVSIHVNAADPRYSGAADARGFETYFLGHARTEDERRVARMENEVVRFETDVSARPGDPLAFILADLAQNEHLRESSRLAELVQASLARIHPSTNRGVKQAGFAVLATSFMPAILIEAGFGSNHSEARYLASGEGQRQLARAIADGVVRYLEEYERRVAADR